MRGCLIRLAVATLAMAAVFGWTSEAHAGVVVSPIGQTISTPTFVVSLPPNQSLFAEVFVTTDGQYDSSYNPLHEVASCYPSTPTGGFQEYSCKPSYYSTSGSPFSSTLPPGTYLWWLRYYDGGIGGQLHIAGPVQITVPQPVAPPGAGLVGPFDGQKVSTTPTLTIHAPANSTFDIYVSTSAQHYSDGTPQLGSTYHCSGTATADSDYSCTVDPYSLTAGQTYYWWMTLDVAGNGWIYNARSFTVASSGGGNTGGGGGGSGGGGSGNNGPHELSDAPLLPRSSHFAGASVQDVRLSQASYALSKYIGLPKMVAVACWSVADWENIGGTTDDGLYTTLAFWSPLLPRFINLSPNICDGIETLLYHRPAAPTLRLADAIETVTHEMMHALGVTTQRFGGAAEAMAECYGMQLSIVMAGNVGVPYAFNKRLAHLNLLNYFSRPPSYQDFANCREGGAWDLFPKVPSPPWHDFGT